MTSFLRAKRGSLQSGICPLGCNLDESVLHVLRDCKRACQVWREIINPNYYHAFFSCDLQGWLRWNAIHKPSKVHFSKWPWTKVFGVICWLLWKHRCQQVFQSIEIRPSEVIHQGMFLLMETVVDGQLQHAIFGTRVTPETVWRPPPAGVFRLEVDASVIQGQQAACGGVIRDTGGNWIMGFKKRLGYYPVTIAEILAIKTGLDICSQLNLPKVQLYSDSIEAINVLARDRTTEHPYWKEIDDTRRLIFSHPSLEIAHMSRDLLRCADIIAKEAHFEDEQATMIPLVLSTCREQIMMDQRLCTRRGLG